MPHHTPWKRYNAQTFMKGNLVVASIKPFLVKEPLNLTLEERFTIIRDWDFSCVRKRVVKYASADFDIDRAIEEYQSWMVLLSYVTDRWLYVPNPELDEVWHTHLIFTRDYLNLCSALCGKGSYIHHQPEDVGNKMSDEEMKIMASYSKAHLGCIPFRVSPFLTSCGGMCWSC
jgi:hypothetical protein